jgi:Ras-related protein Rab-6A
MTNQTYKLKMVMIGDTGVGKSCIIARLIYNTYNSYINPTIGAQYMCKQINENYRLDIWDTAGQERFRSLISMYIRGANIVCFVVSLDKNDEQIKNEKKYWLTYIKKEFGLCTNYKTILVYNKKDLNPNYIYIHDEDFDYSICISCKTRDGIDKLNELINKVALDVAPSISENKYIHTENKESPMNYKEFILNYLPKMPKNELISKNCNIL